MIGYQRVHPVKDDDLRREWAATKCRCQLCGCLFTSWLRSGQVHHLIRGAGKSDEPCCFLMVCSVCHKRIHGEIVVVNGVRLMPISFAETLLAKRLGDPAEWNPGRLAKLYGRPLPEGDAPMNELTPRQQEIVDFIRRNLVVSGPTFREIGRAFGIRSPNGVGCHVKALVKKGVLLPAKNAWRGIVLTETRPYAELVEENERLKAMLGERSVG